MDPDHTPSAGVQNAGAYLRVAMIELLLRRLARLNRLRPIWGEPEGTGETTGSCDESFIEKLYQDVPHFVLRRLVHLEMPLHQTNHFLHRRVAVA